MTSATAWPITTGRATFHRVKGPSYLSVHLRHGTISIRALARTAHDAQRHGNRGAETWLSELIWRDFYFSVLHHFPYVGVPGDHKAFKPEYDRIEWETGEPPIAISPRGARAGRVIR